MKHADKQSVFRRAVGSSDESGSRRDPGSPGPQEKIVCDIESIKTRSAAVDLRCVLKTLQTVFRREGAR